MAGPRQRQRAGERPWRAWVLLPLGLVVAVGALVLLVIDADAHHWWSVVGEACAVVAGVAAIMRGREHLRASR